MKSPRGPGLVFQLGAAAPGPAAAAAACGSAWIKALHYRKRKQHMLSLFYMGLNGFPLMHACVNVRFPSPLLARPPRHTRDHARAHASRLGQDGHPHILCAPTSAGRGRHDAGPDGCRGGHGGQQWKDVVYCFRPWGNRARAAKADHRRLTHVMRPMTDCSKGCTRTRTVNLNFSLQPIVTASYQ